MTFEFFEYQWAERPDWIERAKEITIAISQEEYKACSHTTTPLLPVSEVLIDTLEPLWHQRKRARLEAERHDEFEQFQDPEEQLDGSGPLEYWVNTRQWPDS